MDLSVSSVKAGGKPFEQVVLAAETARTETFLEELNELDRFMVCVTAGISSSGMVPGPSP